MTNGVNHMTRDRRLQKHEAVIDNIVDWKKNERSTLIKMNKEKERGPPSPP